MNRVARKDVGKEAHTFKLSKRLGSLLDHSGKNHVLSILQAYHAGGGCEELCLELGRVLRKSKHLSLLNDIKPLILPEDTQRFKNEALLWTMTGAAPTRMSDAENHDHARVGQALASSTCFEAVVTRKKKSDELGFTLRDVHGCAVVKTVEERSPSARAGIREGDLVVAVSRQRLQSPFYQHATHLLRKASGKTVRLIVVSEALNIRALKKTAPTKRHRLGPQQQQNAQKQRQPLQPRLPQPLMQSQQSRRKTAQATAAVSMPTAAAPSGLISPTHAGGSIGNANSMSLQVEQTIAFQLPSDDSPLGFELLGGVEDSSPIIIGEVVPDSVADQAGLKRDAHILSVNGVNFRNLPHSAAVEVMRSSPFIRMVLQTGVQSTTSQTHTPLSTTSTAPSDRGMEADVSSSPSTTGGDMLSPPLLSAQHIITRRAPPPPSLSSLSSTSSTNAAPARATTTTTPHGPWHFFQRLRPSLSSASLSGRKKRGSGNTHAQSTDNDRDEDGEARVYVGSGTRAKARMRRPRMTTLWRRKRASVAVADAGLQQQQQQQQRRSHVVYDDAHNSLQPQLGGNGGERGVQNSRTTRMPGCGSPGSCAVVASPQRQQQWSKRTGSTWHLRYMASPQRGEDEAAAREAHLRRTADMVSPMRRRNANRNNDHHHYRHRSIRADGGGARTWTSPSPRRSHQRRRDHKHRRGVAHDTEDEEDEKDEEEGPAAGLRGQQMPHWEDWEDLVDYGEGRLDDGYDGLQEGGRHFEQRSHRGRINARGLGVGQGCHTLTKSRARMLSSMLALPRPSASAYAEGGVDGLGAVAYGHGDNESLGRVKDDPDNDPAFLVSPRRECFRRRVRGHTRKPNAYVLSPQKLAAVSRRHQQQQQRPQAQHQRPQQQWQNHWKHWDEHLREGSDGECGWDSDIDTSFSNERDSGDRGAVSPQSHRARPRRSHLAKHSTRTTRRGPEQGKKKVGQTMAPAFLPEDSSECPPPPPPPAHPAPPPPQVEGTKNMKAGAAAHEGRTATTKERGKQHIHSMRGPMHPRLLNLPRAGPAQPRAHHNGSGTSDNSRRASPYAHQASTSPLPPLPTAPKPGLMRQPTTNIYNSHDDYNDLLPLPPPPPPPPPPQQQQLLLPSWTREVYPLNDSFGPLPPPPTPPPGPSMRLEDEFGTTVVDARDDPLNKEDKEGDDLCLLPPPPPPPAFAAAEGEGDQQGGEKTAGIATLLPPPAVTQTAAMLGELKLRLKNGQADDDDTEKRAQGNKVQVAEVQRADAKLEDQGALQDETGSMNKQRSCGTAEEKQPESGCAPAVECPAKNRRHSEAPRMITAELQTLATTTPGGEETQQRRLAHSTAAATEGRSDEHCGEPGCGSVRDKANGGTSAGEDSYHVAPCEEGVQKRETQQTEDSGKAPRKRRRKKRNRKGRKNKAKHKKQHQQNLDNSSGDTKAKCTRSTAGHEGGDNDEDEVQLPAPPPPPPPPPPPLPPAPPLLSSSSDANRESKGQHRTAAGQTALQTASSAPTLRAELAAFDSRKLRAVAPSTSPKDAQSALLSEIKRFSHRSLNNSVRGRSRCSSTAQTPRPSTEAAKAKGRPVDENTDGNSMGVDQDGSPTTGLMDWEIMSPCKQRQATKRCSRPMSTFEAALVTALQRRFQACNSPSPRKEDRDATGPLDDSWAE